MNFSKLAHCNACWMPVLWTAILVSTVKAQEPKAQEPKAAENKAAENWESVVEKSLGFRVSLPGIPAHSQSLYGRQDELRDEHTFVLSRGDMGDYFYLNRLNFSPQYLRSRDARKIFESQISAFQRWDSDVARTITNRRNTTLNHSPGLEANGNLLWRGHPSLVKMRCYLIGQRAFLLVLVSPTAERLKSDGDRFFGSFQPAATPAAKAAKKSKQAASKR